MKKRATWLGVTALVVPMLTVANATAASADDLTHDEAVEELAETEFGGSFTSTESSDGDFSVPILNSDVPDVSVERVPASESGDDRDVYYMISTTMHLSPGAPIMKSYDLVNWETVNYVYDRWDYSDQASLRNGENSYGQGQWASSLKYHDGKYYVAMNSLNLGGAFIYVTEDVENGPWEKIELGENFHDLSLFFTPNGDPYIIYGGKDLHLVELSEDLTTVINEYDSLIDVDDYPDVPELGQEGLGPEGAQVHYIDGNYYIATIIWPPEGGRQVALFRSPTLLGKYDEDADGENPYEAKIVLDSDGFAQGSLVEVADDAGESQWHGFFFRDTYPTGRIPAFIPTTTWEDGWPVFETPEKGDYVENPITLPDAQNQVERLKSVVTSDNFDNRPVETGFFQPEPETDEQADEALDDGSFLAYPWQWNHNPDDRFWSLTDRDGWLRLTNGSQVTGEYEYDRMPDNDDLTYFEETRNTLSQRTFGPKSSAETKIDISGMKDGDRAGLAAYTRSFGYAAVERSDGVDTVGVALRPQPFEDEIDHADVEALIPETTVELPDVDEIWLKADADLRTESGELHLKFYYSLDGQDWERLGDSDHEPLTFDWELTHFMGYRFGLFTYATESTGGYADFDYYYLSDQLSADEPELAADVEKLEHFVSLGRSLALDNYPESDREELEDALSFAEESLADGMYTANQVDAPLMELSRALADANEFFAEEESVAQLSVGDIDFGAIDEDDLASAQARLEVENTGDVPVTVSDITLNNGESFTVSEGDHEPIEPGGVETSSGIAPADDLEPGTYEDDVHVAFEGGEATATVRIDVQEVSGSPGPGPDEPGDGSDDDGDGDGTGSGDEDRDDAGSSDGSDDTAGTGDLPRTGITGLWPAIALGVVLLISGSVALVRAKKLQKF